MQLCNRIYYSRVYWKLSIFRAAHRSSSGVLNYICSLWFIYTCGDRPLPRLCGKWHISHTHLLFQSLLKAQHVSSGSPLIIRSSKLYLQLLVYIHMWWPAVAKAEWEMCHFPHSLGNGRSPRVYINQRLQIEFRAPDDEWCFARNMFSLQ